ncbi:MAG: hypothetical protein MPJ50_13080 [Pirellulales bacterium]|nr:hypothetical protein [Pirellulales bacterium]
MPHRLQTKIAAVTRKAWLCAVLWGTCVAISGVIGLLVAGGGLDFLLRFEDQGLRILFSGALLAGISWLCWRLAIRRFKTRVSPQTIAEKLERQHPELKGQLRSALEFLEQPADDARAGSAVLRRAVIARTDNAAGEMEFAEVVSQRPLAYALTLAVVVIASGVAFCTWQPQIARTALVRLGNPLSQVAWPRASNLRWRQTVTHVPRGGTFEVEIVDALDNPLPVDVQLEIRYRASLDEVETLPMRFANGSMRFRREGVVRPFEYRAVGGDDQHMEWTSLDVIEPPEVDSLDLQLHPSAYTAWPVRQSSGRIEVLVGTYVAVQGTSTKKLQAADVVLNAKTRIPATIGDDGYRFSISIPNSPAQISETPQGLNGAREPITPPVQSHDSSDIASMGENAEEYFIVSESGVYSIHLVDVNGYASADQIQYEIRAIPDDIPRVNIDEPASDLIATSNARVPLKLSAADDLLLRDLELRYTRSDKSDQGNLSISFYHREGSAPIVDDWPDWLAADDALDVNYAWELRDLNLLAGTRVTYYAVAGDYAGQVGQSPARRLTIVTTDQLQEQLAQEQAFVVDELGRVLETQVAARGQLGEIQLQLRDVGRLKADDIDTLQTVEITQRNVDRSLLDESGVRGRVQRLMEMIVNNRLDSPDLARRMQGILDAISRVSKNELPQVAAALTVAVKDAQLEVDQATPSTQLVESVHSAAAGQDRVIHELERVVGDLSQWNNYRRFFRDMGRIRQDHSEVAQDVAANTTELLGKRHDQLTPQEKADLAKLQSRHDDLARRLETLQGQMQPMIDSLREDDPLAADVLSDALALAESQALGQQLRQAGNEVQQNRVSSALQSHETIGEVLQEMLDVLANKREHELSRLAKKLEQAARDLQGLNDRQAGLRKQMQQSADINDLEERRRELERLAAEQRKLAEETGRAARKLERLQSRTASQSSSNAAGRMSQAADAAAAGNSQAADQQMEQAQRDIEDAQRQIEEQRKQIQRDLEEELIAKTIDSLRGLHGRQQALLEESLRLEQLRKDQSGSLSRGQLISLRDLERAQELLRTETATQAERLRTVPAFAVALNGAADQMKLAVSLLRQQDESSAALRQRDAVRRIDQLLQALKPPSSQQSNNSPQDGQDPRSQSPTSGDDISRIAQLRLLKMLQEALNKETRDLDIELSARSLAGFPLTEAQQQRFAALSREQGRLADLILEMSQPGDDNPLKELETGQDQDR